MASAKTVTPASEWGGEKQPELVELPSGKRARLSPRLNAWALVRQGVFSSEVLALYMKADAGALNPAEDDLAKVADLNDLIVEQMFVEPRVFVPDEDEDECPDDQIHIDDIGDDDITFVIQRAMGGVQDAAQFRGDGRSDDAGADGEGVVDDPEQSGGSVAGDGGRVPPRPPARRKSGSGAKRAAGKRKR